jgi:NADH:ubiquinone oxidoreductase subunit 2 (subunit N)
MIAVLTMTLGNIAALLQSNIKRMLAYSSIAHAGYILIALVAMGAQGVIGAVLSACLHADERGRVRRGDCVERWCAREIRD